jgi:hypothetical protein
MKKILFVVVAGLVLALASYSPAQGDKAKKKDIDELKKIFGPNNVTVILSYSSTTLKGQITGGKELFGRQYLMLSTDSGLVTLVDTASIAAIKQER